MAYYLIKIVITTALVLLVTEVAKQSSLFGGILASIPIVSVLAMIWLYIDTKDIARVSTLSTSVFWLVIPSLVLFLLLPFLLKKGLGFYLSLGLSAVVTVACYFVMISSLAKFGVKL